MSTNVKKVGFSYALKNIDRELLKGICDKLNQDYDEYDENEFYPYFDNEKHMNRWIVVSDYNSDYGLVKIIDYEYDSFDLVSKISAKDLMDQLYDLNKTAQENDIPLDADLEDIKTFSMLYYNGSDEPFTF